MLRMVSPSSDGMLLQFKPDIIVHFKPSFTQQHVSSIHLSLQVQEGSSTTSSGAGFELSYVNFKVEELMFELGPCGQEISGLAFVAPLIAA